ncbi:hypothetical protein PF005_g22319 [Phytophthora fragariae]|uniref:Uncharacterized protein n=1 Tax=Phytophthora fragariae TaxID=53985 RepID=A0A6A3S5I7_9STRA|nr:hypothetical protein PF009_g22517 [Phytophthora fragariae]KAE8986230.1 hypothetical protein PF011_g20073 [Phytophthora fragariae]KAE9084309.1 hypothetical protein PF007_g21569 [Phytophthora fragariae]KAE9109869.1 hypothetical protein PF006_g20573 [Phytophthora fragariae]KAE9182857.1 hypothetical protein PF005_g22319 [Phytophthora fragariae]
MIRRWRGGAKRQHVNGKRRRGSQSDALSSILDRVNVLLDLDTSDNNKAPENTWIQQKLYLQEQRAAQNLSTLYAMLDRNVVTTQQLLEQRWEYIAQGLDAAELGQALQAQQSKKTMLENQIGALELQILNGRRKVIVSSELSVD